MRKPLNFQDLIRKVRARKPSYTLEWIAARCNVNYTTIHQLKSNIDRQPRYELGAALVDLERRTRPRRKSKKA
jgi:hypothetical protein